MTQLADPPAGPDPTLTLPRTVRSRIVKERGILAAQEVEGETNAISRVELLEHRHGRARYRLTPRTGQTHQLRCESEEPFAVVLRVAALDGNGVPLLPTQLPELLPEW